MSLLQEGQLIRDTYEVERFLGEGAFAEVYRVKHRFLGRQAMKVFKRGGMTIEEIEETLGEAVMLSRLGHPNIVRVFDANVLTTDRGLYGFFTMENVPGGSLEKFWHSHGPRFVPVETTIDLIKQVCRGLKVAHRQNPPVIHRDIKPQNILVGYEPEGLRARLSDFGLAKKSIYSPCWQRPPEPPILNRQRHSLTRRAIPASAMCGPSERRFTYF